MSSSVNLPAGGFQPVSPRNYQRFVPEPRSSAGANFKAVIDTVGSVASSISSFPGLDPAYQSLISKQIEVQKQMQMVTLQSNIEKSKHETQMSAIRNMRAA
jgi:hypothetical protein